MVPLERLHFADVSEGNRKRLKSIGFALLTDKRVDSRLRSLPTKVNILVTGACIMSDTQTKRMTRDGMAALPK